MSQETSLPDDSDGVKENIPADFSTGGLTLEDRGYKQQTFLGASIRSFNMKAGFGDESSTLSIDLVEDEYNKSDETPVGYGADVYHDGKHDKFVPPFIGSPVFFTFGKDYADITESFIGVFDHIYSGALGVEADSIPSGITIENGSYSGPIADIERENFEDNEYYDADQGKSVTIADDEHIGREHLTFGGILHSFVETTTTQGNKLYSAKVSDPREILDSVQIILNDFSGSVNETDNIFNIYGFLEYNTDSATIDELGGEDKQDVLERSVDPNTGKVTYSGTDTYIDRAGDNKGTILQTVVETLFEGFGGNAEDLGSRTIYDGFPITGTGFSRRSDRGIPYYRIAQGVNWLIGNTDDLPEDYKKMSFGDKINFRGLKYIVDLSGLPTMPDFYSLDFDSMTLLDLCLEICDVTNTDLYVTLLPIIDHPACSTVFGNNPGAEDEDLVVGMIRVDAIDRKEQPSLGAVKEYLDDLDNQNIYVQSSDTGYELANITTDKFVVGAQETNIHFFSNISDKDHREVRKDAIGGGNDTKAAMAKQWELGTAVEQQIIPYYGTLGKNCVSLPRGWGAYQQILLDTTGLSANGVGNYYVATELELRAAIAGYEKWTSFLMQYNRTFMEPCEDIEGGGIQGKAPVAIPLKRDDAEYAVTVPRSVFPHYGKNQEDGTATCNPPMGWPLYWNRANILGVPLADLARLQSIINVHLDPLIEKLTSLSQGVNPTAKAFLSILSPTWGLLESLSSTAGVVDANGDGSLFDQAFSVINQAREAILNPKDGAAPPVFKSTFVEDTLSKLNPVRIAMGKAFKQGEHNSKIVHHFLQEIANECLGRKYLIRIPNRVNVNWDKKPDFHNGLQAYTKGPFGFRPQPKGSDFKHSDEFISSYNGLAEGKDAVDVFISRETHNPAIDDFLGAVKTNYNPFSDRYEFNYYPETEGGFFSEDIYKEIQPREKALKLFNERKFGKGFDGLLSKLIPFDLDRFITENNRICPYVRFDNSQGINLSSLSKEDFVQESIGQNGNLIPDVSLSLDNVISKKSSDIFSYTQKSDNNPSGVVETNSVLFLKCSVDTNFYYLPKTVTSGTYTVCDGYEEVIEYTAPKESFDVSTNEYTTKAQKNRSHFIPSYQTINATYKSANLIEFVNKSTVVIGQEDITIDTSTKGRDLEYIYALITLPARLEPTEDRRFRDGTYQQINPEFKKHLLSMDVVKGFAPFTQGKLPHANGPIIKPKKADAKGREVVDEIDSLAQQLEFSLSKYIAHIVPTVAAPSMVALPLLSTERCYGPWNSQNLDTRTEEEKADGKEIEPRYIELGGPVDFIKEENISPWNYAGYKGMNEAGKLQAQFANNLLLISERGSFSYADAPKNVYLAKELKERGPLVTNINVSISPRGIVTNLNLDLYTVGFGKLHKHREKKLQETAREKIKSRDEKNLRIRKNIGKKQKNEDYNTLYAKMERDIKQTIQDANRALQNAKNSTTPTHLIGTITESVLEGYDLATGEDTSIQHLTSEISYQCEDVITTLTSQFSDVMKMASSYMRSAGGTLEERNIPVSLDPSYPHMPSVHDPNVSVKQNTLYPEITLANITEEDLSTYDED
jgi:hypothetical protein